MAHATTQYTTSDLAERVHGELRGRSDLPIVGINSMDEAKATEITFIADASHARRWREVVARAAVVSNGLEPERHNPRSRALIFVPDARLAVIKLLSLFEPPSPSPDIGIHPFAVVHRTASIGRQPRIGPHVSIDQGATIGDRVTLHAGVRVYPLVVIGDDSVLHANTVVRARCRIGHNVILHQNVSIGADGFGFQPAPDGSGLLKEPQIGTVIIEDHVEVGANTCIDRGKFGATMIGAGTKIDNLVQIGHNCRIGRGCVIVALTGVGGSVVVGDGARLGGAVGIADHLRIGKGATVGAGSGVVRDVPDGQTHLGYPANDATATLRQWASIRKLPKSLTLLARLLKMNEA